MKGLLNKIGETAQLVVHSGAGQFAYPLIRDRIAELLSIIKFDPVGFHLLRQSATRSFLNRRAWRDDTAHSPARTAQRKRWRILWRNGRGTTQNQFLQPLAEIA